MTCLYEEGSSEVKGGGRSWISVEKGVSVPFHRQRVEDSILPRARRGRNGTKGPTDPRGTKGVRRRTWKMFRRLSTYPGVDGVGRSRPSLAPEVERVSKVNSLLPSYSRSLPFVGPGSLSKSLDVLCRSFTDCVGNVDSLDSEGRRRLIPKTGGREYVTHL